MGPGLAASLLEVESYSYASPVELEQQLPVLPASSPVELEQQLPASSPVELEQQLPGLPALNGGSRLPEQQVAARRARLLAGGIGTAAARLARPLAVEAITAAGSVRPARLFAGGIRTAAARPV